MDGFDASLNIRLTEDATLVAMLPEYERSDGMGPNVFLDPQVPEDARRPYVWVHQPDTNTPWESKNHRGREAARFIWVVGENLGSWGTVQAIAARIEFLLHRKPLSYTDSNGDLRGVIAEIFGPTKLDTDESLVGLTMTLSHHHTKA